MWQAIKEVQHLIRKSLMRWVLKYIKYQKVKLIWFLCLSAKRALHYEHSLKLFSRAREKSKRTLELIIQPTKKKSNSAMVAGLATVSLLGGLGGLILIPLGIAGIIQCIKL